MFIIGYTIYTVYHTGHTEAVSRASASSSSALFKLGCPCYLHLYVVKVMLEPTISLVGAAFL